MTKMPAARRTSVRQAGGNGLAGQARQGFGKVKPTKTQLKIGSTIAYIAVIVPKQVGWRLAGKIHGAGILMFFFLWVCFFSVDQGLFLPVFVSDKLNQLFHG